MGIHSFSLSLLVELKSAVPDLGGTVLQLGRQDVHLTGEKASRVFRALGVRPAIDFSPLTRIRIDDGALFRSLGFTRVESADFSDYEHPSWTHDFNLPVPPQKNGQYDAVFDGGTLEHIFNLPEALRNVTRLLKAGGVAIHLSPCNNWFEHGFYSFNPAFFWEYYQANGFQILQSCLVEFRILTNRCRVTAYDPATAPHVLPGRGPLMIWFVARKPPLEAPPVLPQQNMFREKWLAAGADPVLAPQSGFFAHLRGRIRQDARWTALLLPMARWLGLAKGKPRMKKEYPLF